MSDMIGGFPGNGGAVERTRSAELGETSSLGRAAFARALAVEGQRQEEQQPEGQRQEGQQVAAAEWQSPLDESGWPRSQAMAPSEAEKGAKKPLPGRSTQDSGVALFAALAAAAQAAAAGATQAASTTQAASATAEAGESATAGGAPIAAEAAQGASIEALAAAPSEAARSQGTMVAAPSEAARSQGAMAAAPSEAARSQGTMVAAPSEAARSQGTMVAAPSEAAQAQVKMAAAPSEASKAQGAMAAAPSEAAQAQVKMAAAPSEASKVQREASAPSGEVVNAELEAATEQAVERSQLQTMERRADTPAPIGVRAEQVASAAPAAVENATGDAAARTSAKAAPLAPQDARRASSHSAPATAAAQQRAEELPGAPSSVSGGSPAGDAEQPLLQSESDQAQTLQAEALVAEATEQPRIIASTGPSATGLSGQASTAFSGAEAAPARSLTSALADTGEASQLESPLVAADDGELEQLRHGSINGSSARIVVGEGDDRVAVTVRVRGDGVTVDAQLADADAATGLRHHARELAAALERHGLSLAQFRAEGDGAGPGSAERTGNSADAHTGTAHRGDGRGDDSRGRGAQQRSGGQFFKDSETGAIERSAANPRGVRVIA